MSVRDFFSRLLVHVASAALVFSVVVFAMETLMPGSVLPYLNPIPFAIAGLLGLVTAPLVSGSTTPDARRPSAAMPAGRQGRAGNDARWRGRLLLILIALVAATSMTLFAAEDGRLGMAVLAWLVISLIAIVVSLWPEKSR